MDLENRIDQGLGRTPADVVIRHVEIFHLTTGERQVGDIAVCGKYIVGVGESYEGRTVIDGSGLTAVPGFIDSHVHVESTLLAPYTYERMVLPHGVTTAICDPHELVNVCGISALQYFLDCASGMCMDLLVGASSCVPATGVEYGGAKVLAADLAPYANHPGIVGLAELMNVPGVLSKDPELLEKLRLFPDRVDGHAPLLGGRELNAYLAAGARNCHETGSPEEAHEKIRKGMQVLIREGSAARNLEALLPLITPELAPFLCFCTDDLSPLDVSTRGHMDGMIARALAAGCDPLAVYRVASWSAACHFGLKDRGLIAPGQLADIVLLSDWKTCRVAKVLKGGKLVDEAVFAARPAEPSAGFALHSVRREPVSAEELEPPVSGAEQWVIGLNPGSLITEKRKMKLPAPDVVRLAVLERYGRGWPAALGHVQGLGLKQGALACSIGHDSHHITVAGTNAADMAMAANELIRNGGGYSVVCNGRLLHSLTLEIGGLLTRMAHEELCAALADLREAARSLGCVGESPFEPLCFLSLPVIPHLRLTSRGLFDVDAFNLIQG